jgi:hypothetical protein
MFRQQWWVVAMAFLLGGCGILPWNIRPAANPGHLYPENLKEPPSYVEQGADEGGSGLGDGNRAANETKYVTSIHARFYKSEVIAQSPDAASNAYRRYLESGMAYSNELCDRWFDDLERVQSRADYGQGSFGIGGAFATTTMGIFSAATKEIAAVAAGFGGVGSWYELGKAVFLFTPDLHIMRGKISELRSEVRTEILSGDMPPSYDQARIQLNDYHKLCSAAQVKGYLDKAIVKTRYDIKVEEQLSGIKQTQLITLGAQFSKELGLGKDAPDIASLKRLYLRAFADDTVTLDAGDEVYFKNLKLQEAAQNDNAVVLLKQIGALAGFDKEAERLKAQKMEAAELEQQRVAADAANRSQASAETQEKLNDLAERAAEATKAVEATRQEVLSPSSAGSRIVVDVVPITGNE